MNKTKLLSYFVLSVFISLIGLSSCGDEAMPKPRGWFRIDIPKHAYVRFDTTYPYSFEYPDYARIEEVKREGHPYWLNIYYPYFDATVYISYNQLDTNIAKLLEDAHTLAYKHISKANDIRQAVIIEPEHRVYGLVYYIKGNDVASPLNFYVTDSVEHFLRASLYFNMAPSNDSLEPVILGIEKDLKHLANTLEWK